MIIKTVGAACGRPQLTAQKSNRCRAIKHAPYIITLCALLILTACQDFIETDIALNDYTVTFDARGGSECAAKTSPRGKLIPLPKTDRKGYTFAGWYPAPEDEDGEKLGDSGGYYKVERNETVYARWSANPYTVTFDAQGGELSGVLSITADFDSVITLPAAALDGYRFDGWHQSKQGEADRYEPITAAVDKGYGHGGEDHTISSDEGITMYAHYTSWLRLDKENGDTLIGGIVYVFVEAGTFTMGSPPDEAGRFFDEVQREVTLTKNFWISKYPVTNRQYGKSVPEGEEDHPVTNVNWNEANDFAASKGGLLPTEAKWEFAARGGNKNLGYVYSGGDIIEDIAWYQENSGGKLHPVGKKNPNELGIYDMSGNVYEWCMDWYSIFSAAPVTDPEGSTNGSGRIIRGGSWNSDAQDTRAANRPFSDPEVHDNSLGFRMVIMAK